MIEKILWLLGSAIFLILGSIHLYYTFFTSKFNARNKDVVTGMQKTTPVLTADTTMWNAWIGFNASHSAGIIFIGLINIILAVQYFPVIQNSILIPFLNIVTAGFYLWLAKKYWFSIPFTGALITTCCFVIATILVFFR